MLLLIKEVILPAMSGKAKMAACNPDSSQDACKLAIISNACKHNLQLAVSMRAAACIAIAQAGERNNSQSRLLA